MSGLMLQRKLQSRGVKSELRYRGDGKTGDAGMQESVQLAKRLHAHWPKSSKATMKCHLSS